MVRAQFCCPNCWNDLCKQYEHGKLAGERFFIEKDRGKDFLGSRKIALETALIPQVNALFAVGLVSLPGMMTGQILSGIEPLMAARYQIMVMCMIFSTAGLSAVTYMAFKRY